MPPDIKVCEECREPWRTFREMCRNCGNRTWDYETPPEVLLEDIPPEDWAELEQELQALERSDPNVKKAAEEYKKELKRLDRKKREDPT